MAFYQSKHYKNIDKKLFYEEKDEILFEDSRLSTIDTESTREWDDAS